MISLEDKKDHISDHTVFLNNTTKEFFFQNIFNEKFKYLLFVEEFDFTGHLFEGIGKYLNEVNESDFFVKCLSGDEYIIPYSINISNSIGYENFKQAQESDITPREFFLGLDRVCLEYLYYSKTATWCGYFNTQEEIGIFAFKTKELAERFMNKFDRSLFYTSEEVINEIWGRIKEEYKEAFLEHYALLDYLKEQPEV